MANQMRSWERGHELFTTARHGARALVCGSLLAAAVLSAGCKSAKLAGETNYGGTNISRPEIIYVTDFQLGLEDIHQEQGRVAAQPRVPKRVRGILSGASENPEARARELVELMANSLVADLKHAGFPATRLRPGSDMPAKGWIITGVFTEVQEGNRLRRSVVGLGQGATSVQLVASVQDLMNGPPQPVQEVATEASSGKSPGGGATLALGPWGAAAKFVLASQDLEKNVKQTASQIAERIASRFESTPKPPQSHPKACYEPSSWEQRACIKPPPCDPHATPMRPPCDPHATLMRPSCAPKATSKRQCRGGFGRSNSHFGTNGTNGTNGG